MKTVEVSQSALESLQKMVEQLQGERDELLKVARKMCYWHELQATWDKGDNGYYAAKKLIAKCTAKPEVLE